MDFGMLDNANEKGFLSTKLLIIIGIVVLLLAGGGVFAYLKFMSPSKNAEAQQQQDASASEPQNTAAVTGPGPIFDLNTFIVNLMGESGRRYLKVTIKLELSKEPLKEEITLKMPDIQDNVLILLSSKSYEDIADVSGKMRLRAEIVNRINNILTSGEIRKVYFTEFVIQ
ncbi:MAG: flagellar basal body-associated FliL family protein [bacterium]